MQILRHPFSSALRSAAVFSAALVFGSTFSGASQAQEADVFYRWVDQHGRVQFTDFEPVGVPSQPVRLEPEHTDEPGITIAESPESSTMAGTQRENQRNVPIGHIGPCADARQQLSVLHTAAPVYLASGGVYRTAWRGDEDLNRRAYLTDEQRRDAIRSAQNDVLSRCSDPAAIKAEIRAFNESVDG